MHPHQAVSPKSFAASVELFVNGSKADRNELLGELATYRLAAICGISEECDGWTSQPLALRARAGTLQVAANTILAAWPTCELCDEYLDDDTAGELCDECEAADDACLN